uniref:Uncharacterized protein n=1 Tax=Moniliophthora roreri TaxID=221103 RepID=A0A0W0G1P2_MONRR
MFQARFRSAPIEMGCS